MIRIYTDAAVKGNPGPVGIGIVIVRDNDHIQLSLPLEQHLNNHQAEFQAVIHGLKYLIEKNWINELTLCYTDSQIVAQSIEKAYAKDSYFEKQLHKIKKMMKSFNYITVEWIPEHQNKGADNLARQALRKKLL